MISNNVLRATIHESLLWLFFYVDNAPLHDNRRPQHAKIYLPTFVICTEKESSESPKRSSSLFFLSLLYVLFPSQLLISVPSFCDSLFFSFSGCSPPSPCLLCLLHGSQHNMSVDVWVCPPFSFCPTGGGAWSSAVPDNLIRVMESCDRL
jgi:hypothetical protein